MKFKYLIALSLGLLFFAACKKENQPTVEKPDSLELLGDSASYTIDGKVVSVNKTNTFGTFNMQTNIKLDTVDQYNQYVSGNKDSVMYGQEYSIHDSTLNNYITIVFAKKFNKNNMNSKINAFSRTPKNMLEMFYLGQHPYAVDLYNRNTQNGIAFSFDFEQKPLKSTGPKIFGLPTTIKDDAQKNSKFEVTKLTKLKSGAYLLEAKFELLAFDQKEKPKNVTNGYLRLRLNTL